MPQFTTKSKAHHRSPETWIPVVTLAKTTVLPGVTTPIQTVNRKDQAVFRKASRERKSVVIAPRNSSGWFSDIGCVCQMSAWSGANTQDPMVILRGLKRVRIAAFDETRESVRIDSATDYYSIQRQQDRHERRAELLKTFFSRFPEQVGNQIVRPLLERDLPFGTLCDLLSFNCLLDTDEYIAILGELDVDLRCDLVMEMLMDSNRNLGEIEFPPPFSWN